MTTKEENAMHNRHYFRRFTFIILALLITGCSSTPSRVALNQTAIQSIQTVDTYYRTGEIRFMR